MLILITALTGCSDTYLDTVPTSSTSTKTIFETTNNAKQAINGIARLMVNQYQDFGQVFVEKEQLNFCLVNTPAKISAVLDLPDGVQL